MAKKNQTAALTVTASVTDYGKIIAAITAKDRDLALKSLHDYFRLWSQPATKADAEYIAAAGIDPRTKAGFRGYAEVLVPAPNGTDMVRTSFNAEVEAMLVHGGWLGGEPAQRARINAIKASKYLRFSQKSRGVVSNVEMADAFAGRGAAASSGLF